MKSLLKQTALGSAAALAIAGGVQQAHALPANALEVTSDVTTDTVWTINDSPVVLRKTVFVRNGASLTIEPGVVVVSFQAEGQPGQSVNGGLVVTRDSQLFALGSADQPVIMTSADDVATWTDTTGVQSQSETIVIDPGDDPGPGDDVTVTKTIVTDFDELGDPATGEWRLSALEWRNLTILGNGVVSSYSFGDSPRTDSGGANNPSFPSTSDPAEVQMEGLLVTDTPNASDVFYGGADDNDDSGVLSYLSIRYGGRVVGTANELNGLSMGGIGRGTDVNHVEIMNNVDDGIETWGGTVNYRNFMVWNVGDDSFDFDQGWRGYAQFGLIVQGASLDQGQGSGYGDNAVEGDGAEDSDGQPRSTVAMRNLTVIGNPGNGGTTDGDGMLAFRDNLRMQVTRSIFFEGGEHLLRVDGVDGDGGEGYGFNGTHTWGDTWQTLASNDPLSNGGETNSDSDLLVSGATPTQFQYDALYDGILNPNLNLNDFRDNVVFDLGSSIVGIEDGGDSAVAITFTEAQLENLVTSASYNNRIDADTTPAVSGLPISGITRTEVDTAGVLDGEPGFQSGSVLVQLVTLLDPRPAADALSVRDASLNVGAGSPFSPFDTYTGAFSPNHNWADGWSAADAYGFFPNDFTAAEAQEVAVEVVALTSVVTFNANPSLQYTVLASDDGVSFEPVAEITGKSGIVSVEDELGGSFDSNKIYKVVVQ